MRARIVLGAIVTATAMAACSTVPIVTSERTTMTKAEIEAEGLICRKDLPPDTNIPRTICASEAAWAAFDDRRRRETDDILAEGRKNSNVGRFNRD
jgi:uncharacterized protein YfaQ (DUF2300 family)